MEWMIVSFPVSGVQTWLWLPPLVAFVISFFTSMVGVSGAFLLLPFQMSVLNFTSPAVSSTNLVFNLLAIPSGVYRYVREGRMLWPLTWIVTAGTLPGLIGGYYVRVLYLPDPRHFKLFAGAVLLYIGYRLLGEFMPWRKSAAKAAPIPNNGVMSMKPLHFSFAETAFEFRGERYAFSTPAMFMLALAVGMIGGIYGIGGGSIIAPFCIAIFGLPVHAVAGAALAATLFTSVVGVCLYSVLPAPAGMVTQPDWALGLLFGIGGVAGMYLGARCQKHVPQRLLKLLLGGLLIFLAGHYISAFFLA